VEFFRDGKSKGNLAHTNAPQFRKESDNWSRGDLRGGSLPSLAKDKRRFRITLEKDRTSTTLTLDEELGRSEKGAGRNSARGRGNTRHPQGKGEPQYKRGKGFSNEREKNVSREEEKIL